MARKDVVGLAVLVMCSVQKVKTTPVVSECSAAIHSTYQYTSDPCGGPCLHLARDVLETRIKDMAGRANREITKYLAENQMVMYQFQLANPVLDLPNFQKSNTLEETFKETYKDLSVYFAFCMQIQQIESTSHIQTDHRYLRNMNKLFSHFLGVIAAGVSESYSVQGMHVSLGSQHCLARDSLEQRAQITLVMRNLNSYFQKLLLYLLSV